MSDPPKRSRRVRRRVRLSWPVILILVVLAIVRIAGKVQKPAPMPAAHSSALLRAGVWRLDRVVDGDTIIVRNPKDAHAPPIRIRLLGIDTPEAVKPNHPVEPWGPEATAFTRHFLKGGELRIRLDRRRVDQYGRSLAYVFVGDEMLNEALVRHGLARASLYSGDSAAMARKLRKAEQAAKNAKAGIWSGAAD